MDANEIKKETDSGDNRSSKSKKNENQFFDFKIEGKYYEVFSKDNKKVKIIFAEENALDLAVDNSRKIKNISRYEEIIIILDYNNLTQKLEINKLEKLIKKFVDKINLEQNKPKLDLIIQNCLLEDRDKYDPLLNDELIEDETINLNKFELSDELYSFSPNIKTLFEKFRADEVVLKKFKFNSKFQLLDLTDFIQKISCKKLTLDDFFVELIIKKDENDDEYNDLDIYFALMTKMITLNHNLTDIKSLKLTDAPLFAIIGDMFSNENIKDIKSIDVDQNSLINPSIITKFKILEGGKLDICFDLDSYKLRLEEEGKIDNYDYINSLNYMFNILVPNWNRRRKAQKEDIEDIEDSGVKNIDPSCFYRLVFKNFDITKYEYITGEDVTYIEGKNWVLTKEEEDRKKRYEDLEYNIENIKTKENRNIKELVFDNCSNHFIESIIYFLKGKNVIHGAEYDFKILKIKKCGKDYVDISKILNKKIEKLIIFDTPLIIGDNFPEKTEKHLQYFIKKSQQMGKVDNLTIKLNALDCYGREHNLNIMKTYEILIELIECENFNKNITFEMNGLSSIMTYLAYKTYVKDQGRYNDPNNEEDGKDDLEENPPVGKGYQTIFKEDVNFLPKYIFFSSKKFRDYLCSQSFKLKCNLPGHITLKNTTIKKCYENYENQNYLLKKIEINNKQKKVDNKLYTTNKELKKMDFGSDGFFIERDYKFFFYENNIKEIRLENVAFSNFKDNNLEGKNSHDYETITNLIGKNKFCENIKRYENMTFPNYTMDMKTFNGIFCLNYGHENICGFFKYYCYKVEKDDEKVALLADIISIKTIFEKLKENIKNLCVIINNIKEQKQFYCLAFFLDFLINEKSLNDPKNKNIPDKRKIENAICNYFIQEKNENDEKRYSDFNYYYTSPGEEKMVEKREITIKDYVVKVDIRFNYFDDYV